LDDAETAGQKAGSEHFPAEKAFGHPVCPASQPDRDDHADCAATLRAKRKDSGGLAMTSEATFYRRAEAWLSRILELCPGAATQLGDHRWDDRLAEYSPAALESQYQEILAALAEVRRYTQSPTQPQSYLMGKLQIVELVSDYCRAHPAASLHEVHDAILGCGSLPPRLMRQRLLGG
jgi:uncharacterized protein (DUF885 family)